jgi:two-component system sensor histidine kinase FlrB
VCPPGGAHFFESSPLAQILDALPGAAVILDCDGVVCEVNAGALALLHEPLVGCTWSNVVSRAFARRETVDQDLLLGSGRWLKLSRKTIPGDGGEILILTDVTDSRQMAELIQRNDRLSGIGEMLAKLAHQLRTPVASALLYARQIRDESPGDAQPARKICDRLTEIASMIDEMLSFAGGVRGGEEHFSVRGLFQEILDTCAAQFEPVAIELAMARADLTAAGNRIAIKGALMNLVENAVQACDEAGHVELGAELIRDRICLTVSDNGHGIPAEIGERLFEPFFTTRPQGTGLGLPVVKAVAEAHGGELIVDSSSAGTTVALCLPREGVVA